jgi:hypothetical protein
MRAKSRWPVFVVVACLLLAGCKKDAEINSALAEVHLFTTELRQRIDSAQDPTVGVDDAQQYLDSRKREIKSRATFLARVRGIQASDETEKKLIETVRNDQMAMTSLPTQQKYMTISMNNPVFKTKLDKLVNDYLELFQA